MWKRTTHVILLILLLTSVTSVFFFSYSVRLNNSSIKTVNDNSINIHDLSLSDPEITITTPQNKTYVGPMSGYYPATFGFENDENSAVPKGWIDNSQPGCSGKVISEKLGHKKVFHLDDDSGNKVYLDTNFLNQSYGTIEMWVLSEDCTDGIKIRGADRIGTVQLFRFGIGQDKWVYYDGVSYLPSTNLDGVYDPLDNTWYHLKIHFRCNGAPNYQALGENKFKAIINGVYESEQIDFWNVKNNMNGITLTTGAVDTKDEWVDAIGYSWDSDYLIGDNLNAGLLLSFDTTFTQDWLGYSLDGQSTKTILGSTTIPFPSGEGIHTLQVFGNNSIGTMYQSDIRYFTIGSSPIFPPGLLVIIIVLASVGGAALVFVTYFVYNKTKTRLLPSKNKPTQAKIKRQKPSTETLIFNCPFCQAELPGRLKFCVYCGTKLEE